MLKKSIAAAMILSSSLTQATENNAVYQIDLIVFAYQQAERAKEPSLHSTLTSSSDKTIRLQTEANNNLTPYHLLPFSSSQLKEEYWALHRKPQYLVLLHYSWLQPFNNQTALTIPKIQRNGWEIEGTLTIQRSNYYSLNSEFLMSTPGEDKSSFVIAQSQRLKGGEIYYFDHPQAGMLIKIHQIN